MHFSPFITNICCALRTNYSLLIISSVHSFFFFLSKLDYNSFSYISLICFGVLFRIIISVLYSTVLFAAGLLLVLAHYIALFRVPFYSDGLQLSSTAAATQCQRRPELPLYFV